MYLDETNTWRMPCGCTEANVLDNNHNVCKDKKTMKKYQVGVKIYNSFEVEASSEEEAEEKVRELDVYKTLMDCDYNITYVDEIKWEGKRESRQEMQAWMKQAPYQSDGTLDYSKICDDEHGNTLGGYPTGSVDFGSSME